MSGEAGVVDRPGRREVVQALQRSGAESCVRLAGAAEDWGSMPRAMPSSSCTRRRRSKPMPVPRRPAASASRYSDWPMAPASRRGDGTPRPARGERRVELGEHAQAEAAVAAMS